MTEQAALAAMREVLQAALQSHVRMGKARPCDCSLCLQIRQVLQDGAGATYSDHLREECAQLADWKMNQLQTQLHAASGVEAETLKGGLKVASEIADKIRVLKMRKP